MIINTKFANEEVKKKFVKECEKNFNDSLKACVSTLALDKNLRFITLSGPTCSGKTTAARIFTDEMKKYGIEVGVISIDDFYYDREKLSVNGKIDYDSVTTINLELLGKTIRDIKLGKIVQIPMYSFKTGTVKEYREYKNSGITMFEGIQAMYPEVSRLFDKNETKSIYISVENEISVNGISLDTRTIRLFRRIVRDYEERNASPEFTLKLWKSVADNEDRAIIPYSSGCDYKINSFMGYEISVIKPHLIEILQKVPKDNEFFGYSRELMKIFDEVEDISSEYIPDDSLYREFI